MYLIVLILFSFLYCLDYLNILIFNHVILTKLFIAIILVKFSLNLGLRKNAVLFPVMFLILFLTLAYWKLRFLLLCESYAYFTYFSI